jgi:hypothetical protein
MTTGTLSKLSAAIEMVTGVLLIASPSLVSRVLLSASLSEAGVAVGRLCGVGLLSLGLACWPNRNGTTAQATRALFAYNLMAAFYLGCLRVGAGFVSYLLWPACALHAVLTALLARPVYEAGRHK